MAAQLFGFLIGVFIASLVHAIIVRWGGCLTSGVTLTLGYAYLLAVAANLTLLMMALLGTHFGQNVLALTVGGWVIAGAIYGVAIRAKDGISIGMGKGILIQLLVVGILFRAAPCSVGGDGAVKACNLTAH